MAKAKNEPKTETPVCVVPNIIGGVAGRFFFEKLGPLSHQDNGVGFEVVAHLRVDIGDDKATACQLPLDFNHYSLALKRAAVGGRTESGKRKTKEEGTLELEYFKDSAPLIAFPHPLKCIVKQDEITCTPKHSRYVVQILLFLPDASAVADLVGLLDSDVRATFKAKGGVTALKGNGYTDDPAAVVDDAGVAYDDLDDIPEAGDEQGARAKAAK